MLQAWYDYSKIMGFLLAQRRGLRAESNYVQIVVELLVQISTSQSK